MCAASIREPLLFQRLQSSRRVLLAGAGGGFDVFATLPLALALRSMGKEISFANLSFTYLGGTTAKQVVPHLFHVTPECEGEERYFPERVFARWLRSRGVTAEVYAFEKTGVQPLTDAYRALCTGFQADALVLVDGGTDILMTGDEAGLGTPEEDMVSLAAASASGVPTQIVACIGFGIDAYHGVCHAHFLENVAALERDGAYLGSFSVPRTSEEGAAYLDAVKMAQEATPERPSIVNGSIAAALRGEFGDAQFTGRTQDSKLFINPLMGLYFAFDLPGVVKRSLYLEQLRNTSNIFQVSALIKLFRNRTEARPRTAIPH
jgi:hypothetical protein